MPATVNAAATITTFRKTPKARTIGVNRDDKPIGTVTKIKGAKLWSGQPYAKTCPWAYAARAFDSETEAIAYVARDGETPDYRDDEVAQSN